MYLWFTPLASLYLQHFRVEVMRGVLDCNCHETCVKPLETPQCSQSLIIFTSSPIATRAMGSSPGSSISLFAASEGNVEQDCSPTLIAHSDRHGRSAKGFHMTPGVSLSAVSTSDFCANNGVNRTVPQTFSKCMWYL